LAAELRGLSATLAARSETQEAAPSFVPIRPARRSGRGWMLLLFALVVLGTAAWFGRDWLR